MLGRGTCAHGVVAALQFWDWPHAFLEMNPDWIKLLNTVSMVDGIKDKNMTCVDVIENIEKQVNCSPHRGDSLDFLGLVNI